MYILILKYILIALCLAYVTHVFSKKKEVMLDVKRHVLEKRLKLYASLHKLIRHNSLIIAPPALMEQYYWSLIDGMPFRIGDQKMEYVSYFSSYDNLNEYCRLIQEQSSQSLFWPKDIEAILDSVSEWNDGVLSILTAFKMMEEENKSLDDKRRKEHLDLACQIFGIALQHDFEYISEYLKSTLADRLQMPNLLNLFKVSFVDKYRLWLFERNVDKADLYEHGPSLMVLLLFIHIRDEYTRDEYDDLPEDHRNAILERFHTSIIKYLPHD